MKRGTVKKALYKKVAAVFGVVAVLIGIKVYLRVAKQQRMYEAMATSDSPEVRMIYYFTEIGKMVEPCKAAGKPPVECVCKDREKYSALSKKLTDLLLNSKGANLKSVAMTITNNQSDNLDVQMLSRKLAEAEASCK